MNEIVASVVVPSFNSGKFLEWTLASIKNQTLENFECIVVDDCSTDNSISSVQAYFKDPRFKLISHKMNVGLSGARNTGLRAAQGKYIAFLDSDDLMMQDSIECRVTACKWGERKSERFVGSYCGSIQIEEDLNVAPASYDMNIPFVDFLSSRGLCPFNANQPMLRADVLRASGGFNQMLKQAEDFDLWQRILRGGYWFAPAKRCSVTYRKRSGSMIRRQPLMHLETSLSIINSTSQQLASDQLDWSEFRLTKPIAEYTSQERKINRVFEFIGMSIASEHPESMETYLQLVNREIPDFFEILNPASSLESLIMKGVKRQIGAGFVDFSSQVRSLGSILVRECIERKSEVFPKKDDTFIYQDSRKDDVWFSENLSKFDIIFIPHSAYHVWTISLLSEALINEGLSFAVIDISPQWRDGGVRSAAAEYDLPLYGLSDLALGSFKPCALVVFNDWDPVTRPILISAQEAGIKTIAIVEGIQDYDDADVHWKREAYKTADVVLLPGEFDRKYFLSHDAVLGVAGVPRIESLRNKEKMERSNGKVRVLINSNFSYGVLEQHRDKWLTDAVEAVLEMEMEPVISRHPADKGTLFPEFVSKESFYDTLETCDVSIQRFASGVLEALAREVGIAYFNPHGEKVDKFTTDTMGAYKVCNTRKELLETLEDWKNLRKIAKENGARFLDHHSGSLKNSAAQMGAKFIKNNLSSKPSQLQIEKFKEALWVVDQATAAFSDVRPRGVPLFNERVSARDKLRELISEFHLRMKSNPSTNDKVETDERKPGTEKKPNVTDCRESGSAFAIASPQKETLLTITTNLLLDPIATLPRIEAGGDFADEAEALLNRGGEVAEQFVEVRNWARESAELTRAQVATRRTG